MSFVKVSTRNGYDPDQKKCLDNFWKLEDNIELYSGSDSLVEGVIELFIALCRWRTSGSIRVVEKQLCDQLFLTNLKTRQNMKPQKFTVVAGNCGEFASSG